MTLLLAKDLLDTLIRARDSESGVVLTNKQLFDHVCSRHMYTNISQNLRKSAYEV
jgi:hypothetical protein